MWLTPVEPSAIVLNMMRPRGRHGGARAGRKSIFATRAVAAFSMVFTPTGRLALDALTRRSRLSRNAIIAWLALTYADQLQFDAPGVAFPGKMWTRVDTIRVPAAAAAALRRAHARTNHSYSDIGEALVREFGRHTTFPPPAPKPAE
jgi:hypothetical protein